MCTFSSLKPATKEPRGQSRGKRFECPSGVEYALPVAQRHGESAQTNLHKDLEGFSRRNIDLSPSRQAATSKTEIQCHLLARSHAYGDNDMDTSGVENRCNAVSVTGRLKYKKTLKYTHVNIQEQSNSEANGKLSSSRMAPSLWYGRKRSWPRRKGRVYIAPYTPSGHTEERHLSSKHEDNCYDGAK
jgi:hypothetical protein